MIGTDGVYLPFFFIGVISVMTQENCWVITAILMFDLTKIDTVVYFVILT